MSDNVITIFTGSRSLAFVRDLDEEPWGIVYKLMSESRIVFVGDCPTGLDQMVDDIDTDSFGYGYGPDYYCVKANWDKEGRSAGPRRNSRMVKAAASLAEALGIPLVCHAWPIGVSRGTLDCMRKAKAAGAVVVMHEASAS